MAAELADDLAAAGGVPDEDRVAQVEPFDQPGQVVGVAVHFVSGPRLAGTAVSAPVVSNGPVAVGRGEERLIIPGIGVERPIALLASVVTHASRLNRAALPDMTIMPLSREAIVTLLDAAGELPPAVRGRVLAEAAGNPLALIELPSACGS